MRACVSKQVPLPALSRSSRCMQLRPPRTRIPLPATHHLRRFGASPRPSGSARASVGAGRQRAGWSEIRSGPPLPRALLITRRAAGCAVSRSSHGGSDDSVRLLPALTKARVPWERAVEVARGRGVREPDRALRRAGDNAGAGWRSCGPLHTHPQRVAGPGHQGGGHGCLLSNWRRLQLLHRLLSRQGMSAGRAVN